MVLKMPSKPSAEIEKRLLQFLRAIVDDQTLHSRWLNTLSFLEHVGSRKIFRARLEDHMNEMLLRHASEEARHALFFKTMARREAAGGSAETSELTYCGPSANRYFQSLDSAVQEYARSRYAGADIPYFCYLLTTWLIEVRAGLVYPLYQQALTEKESSVSLKSIILEEEGHLSEMNAELEVHNLTSAAHSLLDAEAVLFERFLAKLESGTVSRAVL